MTDDIVLARYATRHQAEIDKGLLDDAGIPCALLSDDAGGWYPWLTPWPARLVVRAEDVDRAREILSGLGRQ